MKHYIDLGTHKFEGFNEYREILGIDESWCIYCYEANPNLYEEVKLIAEEYKSKYNLFIFENKVVSDNNEFIIFHAHKGAWWKFDNNKYDETYTWGSNALENPPTYDYGNGTIFDSYDTTVQCINILDIYDNICNNDAKAEIYIKCDIEGSEYKVVPKLLSSSNINKLKAIYIEWHERFWSGEDYNLKILEKNDLINKLTSIGIECSCHH